MRVFITGATGFIGRAVCEVLVAHGHAVHAAVRQLPAMVPSDCVVAPVGEIDDHTQWRTHLEGMDAVVHLAARTHLPDGRGARMAYQRINVEGTNRLALAARAAGVGRFVFMSSAKVNGEISPRESGGTLHRFSGDDPPAPTTLYGQSKWAAEQLLQRCAAETSMRLAVLRPPLVYGPGQKGNLASLMRAIDKGVPLPFAGIDNQRSLIGVTNLADAVQRALVSSELAGIYTVRDVELSSAELACEIAAALGTSARLFHLPQFLLSGGARLLGRGDVVEKLTGSLVVDSTRFSAVSGWTPAANLREVLREAAAVYRTGSGPR